MFERSRYIVKVDRAPVDRPALSCGLVRAFAGLVLAATAISLASCGRLVVLADDPWWGAVAAGSTAPARQVAKAVLAKGYWPTFLAVAEREDASERLEAVLGAGRIAVVVIGPPLSTDAAALAARHPGVTFILLGGLPGDDGFANTVQLAFDRTTAFREAGRLAAAAGPTAVLSTQGRPDAETAAFVAGVGDVEGAPRPLERVLPDRPDTAVLETAVSVLRAQGVSVFLYRPTGSRAAFLDVLAAAGGSGVVEDWAVSRPRPGQVLASIEDDIAGGIAACLSRGAPAIVSGSVRVVRGEAGGP
jgi:hypothetical protein